MLSAWLFLEAYGLVLIACVFLLGIWGTLLVSVVRSVGLRGAFRDTYMAIVFALFLNALASAILFGSRTLDSFSGGEWTPPPSGETAALMILAGTLVILCAKGLLIYASDRGRPVGWVFPLFLFTCLAWTVGTSLGVITDVVEVKRG